MPATPHPHALNLIRSEYLEMPGLTLKPQQVQRLCGIDRATCQDALDALVETGFLTVRVDGSYSRSRNGEVRLNPAKADLVHVMALTKLAALRKPA